MATMKILVIGGGGGTGGSDNLNYYVAGGGGGKVTYDATHSVSQQSYSVTVGGGGTGTVTGTGGQGNSSVFDTITTIGGLGGYYNGAFPSVGGDSGSGKTGGASVYPYSTSGGGAGDSQNGNTNGTGGNGTANSISGSSVYYGGGGGGANGDGPVSGGLGGGGTGGDGTANTGGGAGAPSFLIAKNGGSGIVIIRYTESDFGTCTGGTITTSGSDIIHTFTSNGTFVVSTGTKTRKDLRTKGNIQKVINKSSTSKGAIHTTNFVTAGGLVDSYSESNQSSYIILDSGTVMYTGQSFMSPGTVLNSCKFYLEKFGSPTGSMTAQVYAHTGTYGSGGTPTGSVLATSDTVEISTITTSFTLVTFTFSGSNKIALSGGTPYFLVINYSGGDSTNKLFVGDDTTSATHGGNGVVSYNGSSWILTYDYIDLCFYVYGVIFGLSSKGYIKGTPSRDLKSKGRIKNTYSKDLESKGRIISKLSKDLESKGWIKHPTPNDIESLANLTSTFSRNKKDIETKARIKATDYQDLESKGNIATTISEDLESMGHIEALSYKDLESQGRITSSSVNDLESKAYVDIHYYEPMRISGNVWTKK